MVAALARHCAAYGSAVSPSVPPQHPAMGFIILNLSANMLGLGNAATPFGLKAMQELQTLNQGLMRLPQLCTFRP